MYLKRDYTTSLYTIGYKNHAYWTRRLNGQRGECYRFAIALSHVQHDSEYDFASNKLLLVLLHPVHRIITIFEIDDASFPRNRWPYFAASRKVPFRQSWAIHSSFCRPRREKDVMGLKVYSMGNFKDGKRIEAGGGEGRGEGADWKEGKQKNVWRFEWTLLGSGNLLRSSLLMADVVQGVSKMLVI